MREDELKKWLQATLKTDAFSLEPLCGDASFRRYFRLTLGHNRFIVMDAPPLKENCRPFVKIACQLIELGLQAPKIYHQELKQGFLVLSDFGDEKLEDFVSTPAFEPLYKRAIDDLITLQTDVPFDSFAPFDGEHIKGELSLFESWYLKEHLKIKQLPDLSTLFNDLIDLALSMPQVAIHRDYHSRNLMVLPDHSLGILDFQDMMRGPLFYDIASLLKDCYVDLGPSMRQELFDYYLDNNPLVSASLRQEAEQYFDFIALQRHLKAIGIFCRLNYRDHKPSYLREIPLVLKFLSDTADKYPELSQLKDVLNEIKTN